MPCEAPVTMAVFRTLLMVVSLENVTEILGNVAGVSASTPATLPAIREKYFASALGLQMRLDEPEPLVDAARDLREQVGRVQVAQFVGLLDGLPR